MKKPSFFRRLLWNLAVSQAPLILGGTTRLLDLIRGRIALSKEREGKPLKDMTLPELAGEIAQLQRRARAIDDAQLEQIKLMQQVVEQNRVMATAFHRFTIKYRILLILALGAFVLDGFLAYRLWHHG